MRFRILWAALLLLMSATASAEKSYKFTIYDAPPWYFKTKDGMDAGMMSMLLRIIDRQFPEKILTQPVPYSRSLAWLAGDIAKLPDIDFIIAMTSPSISSDFVKCASLGSFSVVAFSLQPLSELTANKKNIHVGVLRGVKNLVKTMLPEPIWRNWQMSELNSEQQIYDLVRKQRLDAGLMTLNVYQYLLENVQGATEGNICPLGYMEVFAWLPRKFIKSQGHLNLCSKLDEYTTSGSMQLDADELIDTFIYQANPDLRTVPRISQKQKDAVVDAALLKLYPALFEQYKQAQESQNNPQNPPNQGDTP